MFNFSNGGHWKRTVTSLLKYIFTAVLYQSILIQENFTFDYIPEKKKH